MKEGNIHVERASKLARVVVEQRDTRYRVLIWLLERHTLLIRKVPVVAFALEILVRACNHLSTIRVPGLTIRGESQIHT